LFAGCIENGYSYNPNNLEDLEPGTIAQSSIQCNEKCSAQEDCQFWTWSNSQCHLKNENALEDRVVSINAISGSANCPGKCKKTKNEKNFQFLNFETNLLYYLSIRCRIQQFN